MIKHVLAALVAIMTALFCAVRVTAAFPPGPQAGGQTLITLPSGGPYRIDVTEIDRQLGRVFEAVTVTLPPDRTRGVLFLDGEQLAPGRTLSRAQAARLYVFSSKETPLLTIGVVPFPDKKPAHSQKLRIRCINPVFIGNAIDMQNP